MHREFEPPEELRESIKCFWYNKSDFKEQPASFEVVPDSYAEIIFYFGNDLSISHMGDMQPVPSPFMIGLLNSPVIFHTKTNLEIIAVRCFPWTVFDLFGLEPGKDGIRLFKHPIAGLQSALTKLIHGGKIEQAIDLVKHYCLNESLGLTTDSMLLKAGVAMTEANGSMSVNRVAASAHTTVRTLERKFKRSSGYSVKDVSGLMRFEQVRNRLWLDPDSDLAGLAHELGYTDQSHLSREFKRYSGTTPGIFAKNRRSEKKR